MKTIFFILTLFFCVMVTTNSVNAQWVQTNGPYGGGRVNCFATSGTDIYAGTGGGVFLSTDNGSS